MRIFLSSIFVLFSISAHAWETWENGGFPELRPYDSCNEYLGSDDAIDSESRLPVRILKQAMRVGLARRHFWNTLSYFVRRLNSWPSREHQLQIFDIACGRGQSTRVLNEFFGPGLFGFTGAQAKVFGIDIDPAAIEYAINDSKVMDLSPDAKSYFKSPDFLEFHHADATTDLDRIPSLPKEADVILIRHQEISSDRPQGDQTWHTIFQQALNHLSPDGFMILTSFSEIENDLLLKALEKMNASIVLNEKNPHAMPLSSPGAAADQYVTIAKRIAF
jgi:SAM-dependent methyltransferase